MQSPSSDCRRQRRTLRSDGSGLSIGRRRLPVGGVCPGAAVPGDSSGLHHYRGSDRALTELSPLNGDTDALVRSAAYARRARRRRCSSSSPRIRSASARSTPPWRMPSSSRMWGSYIEPDASVATAMGLAGCAIGGGNADVFAKASGLAYLCRVVGRGIHARQCSELEHSLTTAFRKRVRGSKQDPQPEAASAWRRISDAEFGWPHQRDWLRAPTACWLPGSRRSDSAMCSRRWSELRLFMPVMFHIHWNRRSPKYRRVLLERCEDSCPCASPPRQTS